MTEQQETQDVERLGNVEDRARLWAAVAKARAGFKPIGKSVEGRKGNQTYKYAPLSAIFAGVDQALADNGIAFQQHIVSDGGPVTTVVTVIAGHGAEIWSRLSFTRPEFGESGFSVKDYGALLTYYRRYAAQTAFGIEGDRDVDDGDSPADRGQPAQPKPRNQERKPRPPEMQQRQQTKAIEKTEVLENKPAVTDEMVHMVVAALDSLVGEDGRPKFATVADVTLAFNKTKGNPQVNDNTIAYTLTVAAKRNLCASVKKGDLTVYVGHTKEDREEVTAERAESQPRTKEQMARIQELAQIIWGSDVGADALKQKLGRFAYKTIGIANLKELDFQGCEQLLEALENTPEAKP